MVDPAVDEFWVATHSSPVERLSAWATPDAATAPVSSVDPGVEARLVERSGDWAKVEFSNGWTGWVDGRRLTPLTRAIPAGGLSVWTQPEPTLAPASHADGGLIVHTVESTTGWVRVEFDNGWMGWVDGRALVDPAAAAAAGPSVPAATGQSPVVGQAPAAGQAPAVAHAAPALRITALPGLGVALVIGGSLMPWVSGAGQSSNSWKIDAIRLVNHTSTATTPKLGLVLLITILAALPYLTKKPLPAIANIALGCVATFSVIGWLILLNSYHGPSAGIGTWVTFIGGVLIAAEFLVAPRRTGRP